MMFKFVVKEIMLIVSELALDILMNQRN